jgi:hypothetical protein
MTKENWTPEAASAIDLCKTWADALTRDMRCDVHLFGSAIYESGDQFDPQNSDLDLVVLFDDLPDATDRAIRLVELRSKKTILELQMVPILHRTNCKEPGVSVVPIYQLELQTNTHKSGARRFFDRNIFLDLSTELSSVGLSKAGSYSIPDEERQAIEYVQGVRNQFLAISANATGGILEFDGVDPLPKTIARVAAQLVPDAAIGTWYDTRFGLEFIWDELARRRSESEHLEDLYRKISIRRGGRGKNSPLSDFDQLLLAEVLYDRAAAFPPTPVATWEIRFNNILPSQVERERILDVLRGLVPDGEIIGIFDGSIIVRLRSSKRSYATVKRLSDLDVLAAFFQVPEVEVAFVESESRLSAFRSQGLIDHIASHIAIWRPEVSDTEAKLELNLAQFLEHRIRDDKNLAHVSIGREALIEGRDRSLRADFLVESFELAREQRIVIELVHLRHRRIFFRQLDRIRAFSLPTILVLVGAQEILEGLAEDIRRVSSIDGAIHIVPIELENL